MRAMFLAVCAGMAGCMPKVQLEVLNPAEVEVPPAVRTIGVVDRSGPRNFAQQVLGTLEGLGTREAAGTDTDGRAAAVQSLVSTLQASPRFDRVTVVAADAKRAQASLFERELSWPAAAALAKQAGVDALVALEAFDSDSRQHIRANTRTEVVDGMPVMRTSFTAERKTDVLTSWRLVVPDSQQVVDVQRETRTGKAWSESGETKDAVLRGLPDARHTVVAVAGLAGERYAQRIGPTSVSVTRDLFAHGHARLREAMPHARANDWTGAANHWRTAAESDRAKVRGRARYNLAVEREIVGDLRGAIDLARLAAVDLDNKRARAYLAALEARKATAL